MRILFITGVSRGLGQTLTEVFEDGDTRIVGFGRTQGEFTGIFHSCDFTKPQLASSIIETALAEEPVEEATSVLFIANAGRLGLLAPAEKLDVFDIEQTISANLTGTAIAASAFIERVKNLSVPKAFIQISSGAALPDRAKASWSLYCASKAGQEQFVRSVANEQENAASPVAFVNINPGVMETAMQVEIRNTSPDHFPEVDRFIKMKEDGKVPSPAVIAQKIAELLADPISLKNGETYNFASY